MERFAFFFKDRNLASDARSDGLHHIAGCVCFGT